MSEERDGERRERLIDDGVRAEDVVRVDRERHDRASSHLGSLEELGCDNMPIRVAADIMQSWNRMVSEATPDRRCSVCKRKLVATIGDGSARPRRRARFDLVLSVCDDDYVAASIKSLPQEDQDRFTTQ